MKTICLVSCVGTKRQTRSQAKDMYISDWFTNARTYAELFADKWFILSAQHGLLPVDMEIEPYNKTLKAMPAKERKKWADNVVCNLKDHLAKEDRIIILAGKYYRQYLISDLAKLCFSIRIPMQNMRIGQQKQWLKAQATNIDTNK